MGVQQLHEGIRVEKPRRLGAAEGFFHNIVVLVLAQPDADGDREAQLFLLGGGRRHVAVGSLAEGGLGVGLADLLLQGEVLRDHIDTAVQEGDPALEAVGHAHLVGLEEDVPLQPEVEVDVLHLLRVGEVAGPAVIGTGQLFRLGVRRGIAQDFRALLHVEDIGVADEALLHGLRAAQDKALALGMAGDLLRRRGRRPAQACRDLLIGIEGEGLVVDHIAAEQLIRPLAGEDDLDMLRGLAVDEIQGSRRGVCQGLVHEILDAGKLLPVFLRADDLADILDPDLFGEGLGVRDLVVGLIVEADRKGL